ncbi:MAG: hypothetical protein O9296_01860 [Novosphingobium sp.]|nr:hypothetical protein [Novosphingobium sp.]
MTLDARHVLDALREATILAERARVSGEPLTASEAATVSDTIAQAVTYLAAARSAAARAVSGVSAH